MVRIFVPPAIGFALCVLIWGGSWLAIRHAVADADPTGVAAVRTLLAFAIILPVAILFKIPRPDAAGIVVALAIGTIFIGANFALVYWSAPRAPIGFASILYATTPLQAALLSPAFGLRDGLRPRQLLGTALGILGIAVAFGAAAELRLVTPLVAITILAAAMTSAIGTVMVRRWNTIHPVWMNVFANLSGGVVLGAYYLVAGEGPAFPQSETGWVGFAYMLIGGSLIAFILYFQLVRAWDAARATFTTLATPFAALVVGYVLAAEPILPGEAVGALLVAGAGYLVLTRPPSRVLSGPAATPR